MFFAADKMGRRYKSGEASGTFYLTSKIVLTALFAFFAFKVGKAVYLKEKLYFSQEIRVETACKVTTFKLK